MTSPWWRGAVIYQVYPRSFLDTDGDGIGDLAGIVEKMGYIASLGVNALWVSPFFKSPMKDYGYDVSDYRAVDPMFGGDADADRLIEAAHDHGLKLIIDMVLAHSSDQHAWFEESRVSRDNPKADWYVWADPKPDGTPPNNWLSVFGGPAWQWESRRRQYYLRHFLKSQPNLNWHNPEVVRAMMGEVRFWLDRGVDGLRLDAITTMVHDQALRDNPPLAPGSHSDVAGTPDNPFTYQEHRHSRDRPEIMERFAELRSLVDRYPDRFLMGEIADVDTIAVSAKYTKGSGALHSCYNFQFTHEAFDRAHLTSVVSRTEQALEDGWITYAFGNHDVMRAVSRWRRLAPLAGDDPALAKLLMACLFSLRGGACLYQGEELGLTEADIAFEDLRDPWGIEFWPRFKGRDGCRTPMPWRSDAPAGGFSGGTPWLPLADDHRPLAVDRQEADPDSPLNFCRRFLAWRKTRPALLAGDIAILETEDPVFAFERSRDGERLVCAFNIANRETVIEAGDDWTPLPAPGAAATLKDGRLTLPPFGTFFGRVG